MRSYLFVPGDSTHKLEKALGSEADALILDLEDSVSADRKVEARRCVRDFLDAARSTDGIRPGLIVRVNSFASGFLEDDLDGLMAGRPDAILLPKCESGADVQHLAALLNVHEADCGLAQGITAIHALITETALGVLNAASYKSKSERLLSLSWGAEDLSADIGSYRNRCKDGGYTDLFRLARSLTLLGATAAGVDAVDAVFTDLGDMGALEEECRAAAEDGFSGKMAVHPRQVPIINRAFTPSAESVARAREIVALFREAGPEAGVLSHDGRMIDRPHLRLAERILKRARDPQA